MPENKLFKRFLILCGLVLTLSASAVFAQENRINKKPLQDFAKMVKQKSDAKEVDLTAPFSIELQGTLNEDGRLDRKTAKFTKSEGDQRIVEIAHTALEVINESRVFQYLSNLDVKEVILHLRQDNANLNFAVSSEMLTENRAKTVTSGFNAMIQLVKARKNKSEMSRNAQDDLALLTNISVTTEGKKVIINLTLPKSAAQEMIGRRLSEVK